MTLEQIQQINVRQYMDWRGTKAKTWANREKALLSHIWNKAREWGYTDKPNPCTGIKGHKETGREVYVEDQDYKKLWEAASAPLRDAMDLAYLTGQRPSDVLRMSETEIRDGVLVLTQAKTKKKLRIAVTGELAQVIARIRSRKRDLRASHRFRW